MQCAEFIQTKRRSQSKSEYGKKAATGTRSGGKIVESDALNMTLHVPCHVAGRTTNGSRWKGKTKTVSLSSFGAHFLLPEGVDLEGEVSILFRIPSALKVMFSKDVFRVKAEIRPSSMDSHWATPSGQKVVGVVFTHPLRFATWAA